MLLRTLRKSVVVAAAIALASACADVLSIDDIRFADDGAASVGGSEGGTTTIGGAGGDGGEAPAENCTNGSDDNDDGLVDCEDPLCVAFTCAATAPEGWSGPYAASADKTAPACPAATPTEVLSLGSDELEVPPAECGACTCDPPTDVACGSATLEIFGESNCNDPSGTAQSNVNNVCDSFPPTESVFAFNDAQPISGTCAPVAAAVTLPETSFGTQTTLCDGPVGAGCNTGEVCVPVNEAPFEEKPCIVREGDRECPTGPYTSRRVLFADVDDTRSCSACTCGGVEAVTCTATSTLYEQTGCFIAGVMVAHDDTCINLADTVRSQRFNVEAAGGSCPPQGGSPTGTATPSMPTTVCCVP